MQFSEQTLLKPFTIDIRECSKDIIKVTKGSLKDLSPRERKAHNIDFELKGNNVHCVYRKWKEIN